MKLKELGEFNFINNFSPKFLTGLPQGVRGIGDDCAVIPSSGDETYLLSTDTLVDSVHFLKDKISPTALAIKSLTVNVSDVAAMGGQPLYILLAVSTPADIELAWIKEFFDGIRKGCDQYGVSLIGGDMTKSPIHLVITVTVIGKALRSNIKYRSTAQTGDVICVTGNIGDSVGGLFCYRDALSSTPDTSQLITQHLNPRAHIEEGLWLSQEKGVNAMIDISDGVESDIKRIMEKSKCGASLELSHLPLSDAFMRVGKEMNWNVYEMAVTGGEDYCLLLTVDPASFEDISTRYNRIFHHPLTAIGTIIDQELMIKYQGKTITLNQKGYDHFTSNRKN